MIFKNADELIANGQTPLIRKRRKHMLDIFSAALEAVDPYNAVQQRLDDHQIKLDSSTLKTDTFNNIYVIGFGKASVKMTQAILDRVSIKKGVVITNDKDAKIESNRISLFIGGHPLPNSESIRGTENCLTLMKECTSQDLLIVLISGGGSALLCHPRISLTDIQETTQQLLRCGATINEINTIRKHLSNVKGGQLLYNTKATVVSFIISDIVEDPIEFIASGPTAPDSTTFSDAYGIFKKYHILNSIPPSTHEIILKGIAGKIPETPNSKDPIFKKVHNIIVANNKKACLAAADKAKSLGYSTILYSTSITGEARQVGKKIYNLAVQQYQKNKKGVFISGGEPTVTVHGHGQGGRNQELVLSCIKQLATTENTIMASFASDGVDGSCDAAGAVIDSCSYIRAQKLRITPEDFLNDNNSYEFFKTLNDYFISGPTGTNIMDIHLIIL